MGRGAGALGALALHLLLPGVLLTACRESPRLVYEHGGAERGAVLLDGERAAGLVFGGPRGLALWPLHATTGAEVTRAFPLGRRDGEPEDHPHHVSLWFAHGDVNGTDFWAGAGRIERVGVPRITGQTVSVSHRWVAPDGTEVATDVRDLRFEQGRTGRGARWRSVDAAVGLHAPHGPLRIGDTKEGTFAVRLRPEFCLVGDKAAGVLRNAAGDRGNDAWGRRARWVAWQAEVEGAILTLAMFDHPRNHGHPTHWHARGYGLCAANPFGVHDFEKLPPGTGELVVPHGGVLAFRHCVWVVEGAVSDAELDAVWQDWQAQPSPGPG